MANILHFCFCCRLARSYIKKLDIRKKIIIQGHEGHEGKRVSKKTLFVCESLCKSVAKK
jgi:hypothetical protein